MNNKQNLDERGRVVTDHLLCFLCDAISLVYHEARNVRHLVHKGLLSHERWRFLVALPTNREAAWREITAVRENAKKQVSVDAVLKVFHGRFHVSLHDLEEMFANDNWRHAKMYGGNAWAGIANLTAKLADAMRMQEVEAAQCIMTELRNSRHNTGSLCEKLARLQKATGN